MTQIEADKILEALKELVKTRPFNLPYGGGRHELDAVRIDDHNERYSILICSYKKPNKFTLQAMSLPTKEPLMRLDIVPDYKCHRNPGGEKIYGPHLHFYKEGCEISTAMKFDPKDKDFIELSHDFMEKFNIINHKELKIQPNLLS